MGADRQVMGRRVSRGLSLALTWITTTFMAVAGALLLATLAAGG